MRRFILFIIASQILLVPIEMASVTHYWLVLLTLRNYPTIL